MHHTVHFVEHDPTLSDLFFLDYKESFPSFLYELLRNEHVPKKISWTCLFICDVNFDVSTDVTGDYTSSYGYKAGRHLRLAKGVGAFMDYRLANNCGSVSNRELDSETIGSRRYVKCMSSISLHDGGEQFLLQPCR